LFAGFAPWIPPGRVIENSTRISGASVER